MLHRDCFSKRVEGKGHVSLFQWQGFPPSQICSPWRIEHISTSTAHCSYAHQRNCVSLVSLASSECYVFCVYQPRSRWLSPKKKSYFLVIRNHGLGPECLAGCQRCLQLSHYYCSMCLPDDFYDYFCRFEGVCSSGHVEGYGDWWLDYCFLGGEKAFCLCVIPYWSCDRFVVLSIMDFVLAVCVLAKWRGITQLTWNAESRWGLGLPISMRPVQNLNQYSVVSGAIRSHSQMTDYSVLRQINFSGRPFYQIGVLGFKVALCVAYLRILGHGKRGYRIIVWATLITCTMGHVACTLVLIFQCSPVYHRMK